MPHYHFNLVNGSNDPDDEGIDLPSLSRARAEAVRYLGELMSDQPEMLTSTGEYGVEVTDPTGLLLFVITMRVVESPAGATHRARIG